VISSYRRRKNSKAWDVKAVAEFFSAVCDVFAMHQKEIVHRDLKRQLPPFGARIWSGFLGEATAPRESGYKDCRIANQG
jgi:hypothetical protein